MSSYYRINYHLRAHKRDPFIEFIKGMLLTPFVLHVKPPPVPATPSEVPALLGDDAAATPASSASASTSPDSEPRRAAPGRPRLSNAAEAHMSNQARYAEIMGNIEELIDEHREMDARGLGNHSRLRRVVPTVGTFFTQLPLREAFVAIDKRHSISARKFVPPSFNDIRRVLNTAQVRAVAPTLRLITFDGDMTLYEDGADFDKDNALVQQLIALLEHDLHVAIVTAAAYGDNAALYERRLSGLLHGFRAHGLSGERAKRFYVMGGECNYLLQCQPDFSFRFIDESTYSPSLKQGWAEDAMQAMIDKAEACMRMCVAAMRLDVSIIRKPRSLGLVPKTPLTREQLDEIALAIQQTMLEHTHVTSPDAAPMPFCAFNGGRDTWFDIGNKLIGVQILQEFIGCEPARCLHVGDQFLSTGNDFATRTACNTNWIINPQETHDILVELNALLSLRK